MSTPTLKFLRTLYPDNLFESDQWIEVRALHPDRENRRRFFRRIEDVEAWAMEHRSDYNVYIGVNPRDTNNGGTKDNVSVARWVWLDIDSKKNGGESARTLLKRTMRHLPLRPSIVVGSGHGIHVYYKIEPTNELERHQTLCHALADMVGGDHVGDAPRILRIPGTFNHKGGDLVPVELIHCDEEAYTYTLQDLEAVTRVPQKILHKIDTADQRGYKSRSERDWAVVKALVAAGFTDATIEYIFASRPIGDKYREDGESYLKRTIDKAREAVGATLEDQPLGSRRASSRDWNIVERDNCFYAINGDGTARQLSTFVIEPKVLLQGDLKTGEEDSLICNIRAYGVDAVWEDHVFTRSAFNRTDTLTRQLGAMAWQWLGSDKDVKRLLPYLMDKLRAEGLPKRTATPIIGLHDGEFVGEDQTLTPNGIADPNEAKKVRLPKEAVHPVIGFEWGEDDDFIELLDDVLSLYFRVNDERVTWPLIGWYTAAILKPKLLAAGVKFPILNLFGTRGSGKTSVITNIMQPMFCYREPTAHEFNTTAFVIRTLLGSTNAIPVSFAEYRSSSQSHDFIERFIRLSYDAAQDSRGRADQTTVNYPLIAPFTIDGEDAIGDPAAKERMIQLSFHPESIAEGSDSYVAYQQLVSKRLMVFGTRLIAYLIEYEPRYEEAMAMMREAFPQPLPDRVRRNFAVVTVGLLALEDFVRQWGFALPAPVDVTLLRAVYQQALENVVNLETGRTSLFVDEFIEDVVNAIAMTDEQRPPDFIHAYDRDENRVYVHLSTATAWWRAKRRRENLPVLEDAAIKNQLKERMWDEVPQPGQYVPWRGAKTIDGSTKHMYAIDLKSARETGLDIPDRISRLRPTWD